MDNREAEIAPERILIIKLSALGDIVQALPVLHSLKKTWNSCQVDWITGEVGAGLLERHPLINRVIVYPRRRLGYLAASPLKWYRLAAELKQLSERLKTGRYEVALDIQGLFKSGIITLLSGARDRVGFAGGREASSLFLNRKLPRYDPDQHAVLRYLKAAEFIGADTREICFPLGLSDHAFQRARDFINSLGLKPREFIILIPGTVWPSKHWSIEGFSKLAGLVHKKFGLLCLVTGSKADTPLGQTIAQDSGGAAIDITGKTSLKLFAALASMAAAGVTTDTGPMHLAAAAGLRLAALFGPTAPWRTGPFGRGHIVLRNDMECSPCFKRDCSTRQCMLSILPEEGLSAVEKILSDSCC